MFNQVTLAGNFVRDNELRYTNTGKPVLNNAIAINENFGDTERVTFVDVTIWGKAAEVAAEYTKKGSRVLVGGRLTQDTWEADGDKRSRLYVTVDSFKMLDRKGEGPAKPEAKEEEETKTAKGKKSAKNDEDDDTIPF